MSSTSNSSSSCSRWAKTKTKTFLECPGQNLFRTVEKSGKNQTVWSQQSSKKKLKMPHFNHLPRPGEINPYIPTSKGVSWGNGHVNPLLFLEQAHLHLLPPISTSSRPEDHRSENISWVRHSLLSHSLANWNLNPVKKKTSPSSASSPKYICCIRSNNCLWEVIFSNSPWDLENRGLWSRLGYFCKTLPSILTKDVWIYPQEIPEG